MSRERTGYSEQPWGYYDEDWIDKRKGNADDIMDRRTFTSSQGTQHVVGRSVLDICCGCGQVANMIDDREYLGIDYSPAQLTWAREHCQNPNAQFLQLDVRQMPEDIGKFDTVIMGEALEHFEDPESIVKLAHRHARKRIVITLPTKNGLGHVWENFEEEDIRKLLRDGYGGRVTICSPFKCLMGTTRWVAVKELHSKDVYPKILVTGASGFIGSHLVRYLKDLGHWVRGVDVKKPNYAPHSANEFLLLDLRSQEKAHEAAKGMDWVFALAADFGGMGYIDDLGNQASVIYNNGMINHNTINAAHNVGVRCYLFTSSVCIYPTDKLSILHPKPLSEEDAYPASPQRTYGWEKLHAEHLVAAYGSVYGMETRIARLQNTYGPWGSWREDPRTKAPGDLCRKVAQAKLNETGKVEVWGDGKATRSFMYVGDCVKGLYSLMMSDYSEPITLGPDRVVSINRLVDIIAEAAGIRVTKMYVKGPQGVRGRNFDHSKARNILGWEPQVSLEEGIQTTYEWIEEQLSKS